MRRLSLPAQLGKCLVSTNIIESTFSGVRHRTGRVTRWRDGAMVLRWSATSALEAERRFRKLIGYRRLWMLKAALDADDRPPQEAVA